MKNQEFKIDTEAGVVVFSQKSHGKIFTSTTKVGDKDKFNIGVGQLIAMKRNEIEIRKSDIQSMLIVLKECQEKIKEHRGTTGQKMYANFIQLTSDKINMSRNHIRELKQDLNTLYNGTYDVKPYADIVKDHHIIRKGSEGSKQDVFKKPYAVPKEIIDGTHIFDIVNGSATIVPIV